MELNDTNNKYITFKLGDMTFEYDEKKNQKNIEKHGISFKSAARVFFDYDRIEFYDEENSQEEERYDTIGDTTAGNIELFDNGTVIGNVREITGGKEDVLFVVYTERIKKNDAGKDTDITRLISARYATNFERGLYYGKY